MALANVGVLMANQGHRLLLVDWDIEAPGLEVFFSNAAKLIGSTEEIPGVLDLIEAHAAGHPLDWRKCLLHAEFFGQSLDIISAGKRTENYRARVQKLDWDALFRVHHIGNFVGKLRDEWRSTYDFILIDSRTGITDVGDICTVLLPDILVLLFISNHQNIEGIKATMARAVKARGKLPVNRSKLLGVPLPARDERDREYQKSIEWQKRYAEIFSDLYREWLPKEVNPADALSKLFLPYVAAWSFGERIPVIESERERTDPSSLGAAYGRLASLLSHRLDWRAIESGASADELIGSRLELSKEREARAKAEKSAKQTSRLLVYAILTIIIIVVGITFWYKTRPEPVSTDLLVGDRLLRQGNSERALDVYFARLNLLDDELVSNSDDSRTLSDKSDVLDRIGNVYIFQGKLIDALEVYQAGKAIVKQLVDKDPDNTDWQHTLSTRHLSVGNVLQTQVMLEDALAEQQAGKVIMEKLVTKDPGNMDWQHDLSLSHLHIGNVLKRQGNLADAIIETQAGKGILEKLVAKDPDNTNWQNGLSVSLNQIGDVQWRQGKLTNALENCQADQDIMKILVTKDPDNTYWQRGLSVSHNCLGNVLLEQGKLADALIENQAGKAIMEKLIAKDPQNVSNQHELLVFHNKIGTVLMEQNKLADAMAEFKAGKAITESLLALDPSNGSLRRDSADMSKDLGVLVLSMERPTEALRYLDVALSQLTEPSLINSAIAKKDIIEIKRYRIQAFLEIGDIESARTDCNHASEAASQVTITPDNHLFWEPSLSAVLMACAEVTWREGKYRSATSEIRIIVDKLHALKEISPTKVDIQNELKKAETKLIKIRD
jgi:tetratricopeptide (TPR) repeat protein